MKRTIKTQLVISYLIISALLIGSLSLITMRLMNDYFDRYVEQKHSDVLETYCEDLLYAYDSSRKEWDTGAINAIGESALSANVFLEITDMDGQTLWSPNQPKEEIEENDSHMKHRMRRHMSSTDMTIDTSDPDYVEQRRTIKDNDTSVATVTFGFYGALRYTEHDKQFMTEMRRSLIIIFVGALPLSLLLASFISKKISLPISQTNERTKMVAKGDYSYQEENPTNVIEIDELIHSVSELSHRLEAQQTQRNRMSTDIAHEIRTPLTTLQGNIEAMLDGIWEVTPERLANCRDEVLRLTRLVGDIEKISRLETKETSLELTHFDLLDLGKDTANNYGTKLAKKNLQLSITGQAVQIKADKDQIKQVLTNLIENAIKFTPPRGRIDLNVTPDNGTAVLSIQDTGLGLTKDEQSFIFERFYMSDPSRNRQLGGQGVGLSIVKSIIEAHHGTIGVTSKLGEGTKFVIRLPLK